MTSDSAAPERSGRMAETPAANLAATFGCLSCLQKDGRGVARLERCHAGDGHQATLGKSQRSAEAEEQGDQCPVRSEHAPPVSRMGAGLLGQQEAGTGHRRGGTLQSLHVGGVGHALSRQRLPATRR